MYSVLLDWTGREKIIDGYVLVQAPEHPKAFNGGWYYEHRLVMERHLGRFLKSWETVHHISGDRTDNSLENLFCCSRHEHDHATC